MTEASGRRVRSRPNIGCVDNVKAALARSGMTMAASLKFANDVNPSRAVEASNLGAFIDLAIHLYALTPKAQILMAKFVTMYKGELIGRPVCITNASIMQMIVNDEAMFAWFLVPFDRPPAPEISFVSGGHYHYADGM